MYHCIRSVGCALILWRVVLQAWIALGISVVSSNTQYLWPIASVDTTVGARAAIIWSVLALGPRIVGLLLCAWRIPQWHRDARNPPPLGLWAFVGNPFAEFGVVVNGIPGARPGDSYADLKIRYVQTPTFGGIAIAALHNLVMPRSVFYSDNIFASDRRSTENTHWMPTLSTDRQPAAAAWQQRLHFEPRTQTTWLRSDRTDPHDYYYLWVHARDPNFPWDDYLEFYQGPGAIRLVSGLALGAIYVTLAAWTWGVIIAIDLVEFAMKRLQLSLWRWASRT